MFLLCHLITGIIIGIVIARASRDRRAIPACAFGALLPDIVDKPLGHIILASSLGYGRVYCHTLLFLAIVTLIGAFLLWRYRNVLVLAAAAGIASHQVLDAMWREPVNWLYPFLGPFTHSGETRSFTELVMSELAEPTEWILLAAVLLFGLIVLYQRRRETKPVWFGPALAWALLVLGPVLLGTGALIAGCALLHQPCPLTGLHSVEDNLFCGLVIMFSGGAALYYRKTE
ncbi:MAG: hypothetical protein PWP08_74 [Methanofollis sp.]|nr:hypothetical protein [Methanofollis sp.]